MRRINIKNNRGRIDFYLLHLMRVSFDEVSCPPIPFNGHELFIESLCENDWVASFASAKGHPNGLLRLLEARQHLRGVVSKLLQQHAGGAEGDFEAAFVLPDQLQQQAIRGQIAFAGDLAADFAVLMLVEVVAPGIEDRVVSQPEGLVNLKVETN